jgi:hypothetical protein
MLGSISSQVDGFGLCGIQQGARFIMPNPKHHSKLQVVAWVALVFFCPTSCRSSIGVLLFSTFAIADPSNPTTSLSSLLSTLSNSSSSLDDTFLRRGKMTHSKKGSSIANP